MCILRNNNKIPQTFRYAKFHKLVSSPFLSTLKIYMSIKNLSYDNIQTVNRILETERYNGRVNIALPEDPDAKFKMFERINSKNVTGSYYDALTGNWEWNTLAHIYFSAENIQIIQNAIKAGVYKLSGNKIVVPNQNPDTLKIIMRSTYLQYAEHYPDNITEQVQRLNDIVLEYAVPSVYNEAVGYMKYVMDQSSLVLPLDHPLNHDRQFKQLEIKRFM